MYLEIRGTGLEDLSHSLTMNEIKNNLLPSAHSVTEITYNLD
jgi:hypothetical protein